MKARPEVKIYYSPNESRRVYICPPLQVIYFEASHWPLDPGPLIIGPGTTTRATIRALPSAHYHLLFNQMIADTKAELSALKLGQQL